MPSRRFPVAAGLLFCLLMPTHLNAGTAPAVDLPGSTADTSAEARSAPLGTASARRKPLRSMQPATAIEANEADSADAEEEQRVQDEGLVAALLRLALPDIDCEPLPIRLEGKDKRPSMPATGTNIPAWRPINDKELGNCVRRLATARRVSRAAVERLLNDAAGIWLSKPERATGRHLLLLFSQPQCPYCVNAVRYLRETKSSVPVLMIPVGRSRLAASVYEHAMADGKAHEWDAENAPGSAGDDHGSVCPGDRVARWLEAGSRFLERQAGKDALVPAYVWVADHEAKLAVLGRRALEALLTALDAREQALADEPGRKQ